VGGRLTILFRPRRSVTSDAFIRSVVTHGFLISPTPGIPGVLREYTGFPRKVSAQVLLKRKSFPPFLSFIEVL